MQITKVTPKYLSRSRFLLVHIYYNEYVNISTDFEKAEVTRRQSLKQNGKTDKNDQVHINVFLVCVIFSFCKAY